MSVNHALNRRQPDACAFELARRMQPLEGREQLARVGRVEACTVVPHEEGRLWARAARDEDARPVRARRELPSVADQIHERYLEQAAVPVCPEVVGDFDVDPTVGLGTAQTFGNAPRELTEVDPRHHERDARDVRQFKTECMQLGSFRNSMRSGEWPGELFCNTTTRLCDGYDSLSNVWGYCAAVLPAILGSEPYVRDVHASLPQRAQLVAILQQCTARERHKRPTPELLRDQLSSVHRAACP